ncbi:enoyl-CoA hydratase/isomerase family protein [Natrialbaceae archaeon AArc-T1-2]|uniref:enoyl-CoA hydratase/isomerase family protein n=1 Tax=Natrialbaceae archaeon AArc-T1-2 TaxID=3053904 RepID=UPI00255AAD2D|nr:enoyl-CoA hydratase/isomerase family protein [Natrialbaceae archaeon AArc-T1-2]WIV66964.1 enoyl-CoA hydratase/isomerase family protein [Natrialbaceae archaeon AArc-T1-2]
MHVEEDDGVLQITFDRPDAMNAFSTAAAIEFAEAVSTADPDDHHAVVLTGEGEAFSAGGDIESMAEREEGPQEAYERVCETFGRVVEELLECPVPVVARVNGDAVGAGLAITALSDFAYAVEDATFSCAFVRVGLIPDTGGTFLLPKLVGLRTAKRLAFTGEFFSAAEAAEYGLITEAVAEDELDQRVDETVRTLERRPTETIGLMKRAIHENLGRHWSEALDYESLLQVQAYSSDAHEEGVNAFLEGREPKFD